MDRKRIRGFRAPPKLSRNTAKTRDLAVSGHQPQATQLGLFPIKEIEVDGVAVMGVLSDGTPYLTLRGLARMCGTDHSVLLRLANNWPEERSKPRGVRIRELLAAQGHSGDVLNIQATSEGCETHVYPDAVCMAVLEYYAFDATQGSNEIAVRNYRQLARRSFRSFIFQECGYDPDRHIPDSWRNFHERILLNDQIPVGYFSVFREMADLVVHMIRAGCQFDDHTVPDISVGSLWGKYWALREYDGLYGQRLRHGHVYPDWFPQSAANPVPAWIYPTAALGVFHNWFHLHYVPQKFPKYVAEKVKNGIFLPTRATLLIAAMSRPALTGPTAK